MYSIEGGGSGVGVTGVGATISAGPKRLIRILVGFSGDKIKYSFFDCWIISLA